MSLIRKEQQRRVRRVKRVRSALKQHSTLPRVSVFRSSKQIYVQLIDDVVGKTVVSCSSVELKSLTGKKTDKAKAVGLELAQRAQKEGVTAVCFDRGSYHYHGRVKAVAEGLREGGLKV